MTGDGWIVRASLEMDVREHVPRGVLTAANGDRKAFSGWTELASAIETWREQARETSRDREQGKR